MFFKSKKIKKLENEIDYLTRQIKELKEDIKQLKRIIEHHDHNKITGYSDYNSDFPFNSYYVLYVYKDGKEYDFKDLYIRSPIFEQGELDNIVYVNSGDETEDINEYILDLRSGSYVKYDIIKKSK